MNDKETNGRSGREGGLIVLLLVGLLVGSCGRVSEISGRIHQDQPSIEGC